MTERAIAFGAIIGSQASTLAIFVLETFSASGPAVKAKRKQAVRATVKVGNNVQAAVSCAFSIEVNQKVSNLEIHTLKKERSCRRLWSPEECRL